MTRLVTVVDIDDGGVLVDAPVVDGLAPEDPNRGLAQLPRTNA